MSGASLECYMQLERTHIRTWRGMAEAFLKYYQYNTDMGLNHTQLENFTQKPDENFKECAQCWMELAERAQPPPLDWELMDMFMGNLQGLYLDRMVCSTSFGFSALVLVGERNENMIKMGKIQNVASTSVIVKKPYVGFGKKREGETNEVIVMRGMALVYLAPYQ